MIIKDAAGKSFGPTWPFFLAPGPAKKNKCDFFWTSAPNEKLDALPPQKTMVGMKVWRALEMGHMRLQPPSTLIHREATAYVPTRQGRQIIIYYYLSVGTPQRSCVASHLLPPSRTFGRGGRAKISKGACRTLVERVTTFIILDKLHPPGPNDGLIQVSCHVHIIYQFTCSIIT